MKANDYELIEKEGFSDVIREALMLSHRTAATNGLVTGQEEAFIDIWYATLPTRETIRLTINFEGQEIPAADAWVIVNARRSTREGAAARTDPIERDRIIAKQRIIIDLLYEMDMLFRRPKVTLMTQEDDIVRWADE